MHRRPTKLKTVLALCFATCSLLAAANSAHATVTPITSGELHWGLKTSFRDYIVNGAAGGTMTAADGAQICNATTCDSDGVIQWGTTRTVDGGLETDFVKFPVTSGSFDDATNTLQLNLGGTLNFNGHGGVLNTTISQVRVILSHDGSVIRLDASSNPMDEGTVESYDDVNFADLNLSGKTPSGTTTWSAIPATMTAAGQPILDLYAAGTALDAATITYTGPGGVPHPPVPPPELEVTDHPDAQSITVGSRNESASVNFTADASGTDPITVKWQKQPSGGSWADIDGETTKSLTVQATAADNGAKYRAVFHNSFGDAQTDPATLTVTIDDVVPPTLALLTPANGSSTTDAAATVTYTVTDNDDPSPACSVKNGASVPLKLGANTITVVCTDELGGHQVAASAIVTRTEAVPPIPAPAAPKVKNGKTVTLKKGKAATVTVGTVTCASTTTCVYTLPETIKIKVGKKTYSVRVKGPATLEPGRSAAIKVTIPKSVVNAVKKAKKTVKLVVRVEVSNTLKTRHETAKNAIGNIR